MEIKEIFNRLNEEQKRINSEAREAIITLLRTLPERKISLVGNCAYSLIEGCDNWLEAPIYGVQLQEDTLSFSTDTFLTEELEDIPSWDKDDIVSENNDYINVNWLSLLEAVASAANQTTV